MRLRDQRFDVDALDTDGRVFRVGWAESPAEHDLGSREGLRSHPNRRDGLRRGDVVASQKGGEVPEFGTARQSRQGVPSV